MNKERHRGPLTLEARYERLKEWGLDFTALNSAIEQWENLNNQGNRHRSGRDDVIRYLFEILHTSDGQRDVINSFINPVLKDRGVEIVNKIIIGYHHRLIRNM